MKERKLKFFLDLEDPFLEDDFPSAQHLELVNTRRELREIHGTFAA